MKPTDTAQPRSENPARLEFKVQFTHGTKGRRRLRQAEKPEQSSPSSASARPTPPKPRPVEKSADPIPKLTRLLVLGHHFEKLVRHGFVRDYAEIARLTGLSRARITQIVNLTLLAPEIQEGILFLGGDDAKRMQRFERDLRIVLAHPDWKEQEKRLPRSDSR